jgi:hypothetical protein
VYRVPEKQGNNVGPREMTSLTCEADFATMRNNRALRFIGLAYQLTGLGELL